MVQSLQLGASNQADDQKGMRRLNRLPIIIAIVIIALFVGVVVIGLSWRGLPLQSEHRSPQRFEYACNQLRRPTQTRHHRRHYRRTGGT